MWPGTVHPCGPEEERQSFQDTHGWCVLCWLAECLWVEVIAELPSDYDLYLVCLMVKFDWCGTFTN